MKTRERQLWLGFIEQTIGCLALFAVAVVRSPSVDFWPSLAMLVLGYVGGIVGATAIVDGRFPFGRWRRHPEAEVDASLWIVGAVGVLVYLALVNAFHWDRWPPSVGMFAVLTATIAAGTIGWGIAASEVAEPVTRRLRQSFRRTMPNS